MEVESKELSEYVRSVVEGVSKGVPEGYRLSGSIAFKLAVVKEKKAEGGFRIYVAEAPLSWGVSVHSCAGGTRV